MKKLIAVLTALCLLAALFAGCGLAKIEPVPEPTPEPTPEQTAPPEKDPPAPRDSSKDLLLVVDFQNVYLPGNEWACPSMPEAMRNTMRIMDSENAPDAVLTKFLAPAEPEGRWAAYNEAYAAINADPYLAEFPEELQPYAERAAVVEKSTYSSMDAPEVLAAMEGKTAVVLAGVVADCCVLATMMDAMDLGYEVVYLYDCIGGSSAESEAEFRALAELYEPVHTTVMSSEQYLAAIAEGRTDASEPEPAPTDDGKNGEVYVLFTSDVHCGVDEGFGYVGLKQIRDTLEAQGYTTLLVDDGDSIQGESIGTLTRGEAVLDLMNAMGYDAAIPGNHEFDYGMQTFLDLTEKAAFPYISCNFTYNDELVFEPYVVLEAAGLKIAFVGVTTPETITSSTPSTFMDENGEFVYGFMRDETGEAVYAAVQSAVDAARAEGADLVYVMGHMGNAEYSRPWTYADVIEHTRGIDVFLDGHSHDTDVVAMRNADGEGVVRAAVGTKLSCIGYSHISADGEVLETGVWSWPNNSPVPDLFGIENDMTAEVEAAYAAMQESVGRVLARVDFDLLIFDPVERDSSGNAIRMVRRAETNMGDFCADVIRAQTGADIAMIGGGGVRSNFYKGDVTYGDVISVWPYENAICIIEATGQQILDALEWGAQAVPGEHGAFMQVSGMTYEVDVSVPSGCKADENNIMTGIEGARRVKNATVGGEPLDPEKTYTVAGPSYWLVEHGDGVSAFDGATVVQESAGVDNLVMLDYLTNVLGGVIGAEYADPYGQGRITIIGDPEE